MSFKKSKPLKPNDSEHHAEPAPCIQQPPLLLFSVVASDLLLAGFVVACLPGGCG
jgi:hypothetical protein